MGFYDWLEGRETQLFFAIIYEAFNNIYHEEWNFVLSTQIYNEFIFICVYIYIYICIYIYIYRERERERERLACTHELKEEGG